MTLTLRMKLKSTLLLTAMFVTIAQTMLPAALQAQGVRQRLCINEGWRFTHGDPPASTGLGYDVRPEITDRNDNVVADTKPTEGVAILSADTVLKKWILPSANDFIGDVAKQHARPAGKAHDEISY